MLSPKVFITTAVLSVAIVGGSAAMALKKPLVCPVTHLTIPSKDAAVGKSVYKGKTYYFCTANCKRLFDKNPAKYAHGK